MVLNKEQQKAFDLIKEGNSVLLTGSAGTGKSFTLSEIISWAHKNKKNIGVTATTGSAAILIKGRTIHSYLGIGLGTKTAAQLAAYVIQNSKYVLNRLKNLDILIIDEISMLDAELFSKISEFLSIIRMNTAPFGGVQIVLCGDFAQIAPVGKNAEYCFKSDIWSSANIITINLKTIIRQKDDLEFIEILECLRWGKCTKSILERLQKLQNTVFDSDILPTHLYGKNIDVDVINQSHFSKLVKDGAATKTYNTKYSKNAKIWADSCKVQPEIQLCIGAQVVLTWNVDQELGLVNGSRGIITGFDINGPIVKFKNHPDGILISYVNITNEDNKTDQITFIPIKLAWAITHHRAQGMTLDSCIIDLSSWSSGQAYTALSRVRDLKSVKLIGEINPKFFKLHKDVLEFYNKI